MHPTPSALNETDRSALCAALNASLADLLDFQLQLKLAHWNVRGPHFAPLHALFEEAHGQVAELADDVAERVATLGERAIGSVREVAAASRVAELGPVSRDLSLVRELLSRLDTVLAGARAARRLAVERGDEDSADLLTGGVRGLEKLGWMLRATAE